SVPKGWTHYRADPDARIPLRFSLAQLNLDKLETFLLEIADPRSYKYGQHCSAVKVKETFQPSAETVETVYAWLTYDGGIHEDRTKLSSNGDILQLNLTIAEAEGLLQSEYYVYGDEDGAVHLGCHDGYTLPEHVSKHVDFVWPTIHFGGMCSLSRGRDSISLASSFFGQESGASKTPIEHLATFAEAGCDTSVTLDCLRSLYKFDFEPVSSDVNTVGAVEFGKNIYRPSDLDLFFESYSPDQVGCIPTLISVEGGSWLRDPTASGDVSEGSLDIEIMMGLLGPRQNLSLYQVTQTNTSLDPSKTLARSNMRDIRLVWRGHRIKRGVTRTWEIFNYHILFSVSYSVAYYTDIKPQINFLCAARSKKQERNLMFRCTKQAEIPAASLGADQVPCTGLEVSATRHAEFFSASLATCTGTYFFLLLLATTDNIAFVEVSDLPAVHSHTVVQYGSSFDCGISTKLTGVVPLRYPLVIAEKGRFVHTGGTSASAPIFASLIAGVNDARLAEGKSPVGFINPAFYSPAFTGAFNDVTVGSNPGCQTEGFPAAPGWDPQVGL
ncbi:Pro-kumamolisin, activation domain-containing protein, partial [Mycena galopus ATCC 62051]